MVGGRGVSELLPRTSAHRCRRAVRSSPGRAVCAYDVERRSRRVGDHGCRDGRRREVGQPKGRKCGVSTSSVAWLSSRRSSSTSGSRTPTTSCSLRAAASCGTEATSATAFQPGEEGCRVERDEPSRPAPHVRVASDRGEGSADGGRGAAGPHGRAARTAAIRAPLPGRCGAGGDGAGPVPQGLDLYLKAASVGQTFDGNGSDEDEWSETPMDTDRANELTS